MGPYRESIVPGNLCIIWKVNVAWPLEKDSLTFSWFLKLLKLKEISINASRLLKFLRLKKGFRHFLMTFKVINAGKEIHHFLTTLKVFKTEKSTSSITVLKFLIPKKNSITFLWLVNFLILILKQCCITIVCILPLLSGGLLRWGVGGGRGWASDQIFNKGGLDRISNFREGHSKREEGDDFFQGWGVAGFT